MTVVLSGKSLPLKYCRYHSHKNWEIILNLEGYGNDIINGVSYPFYPGAIICVPPNMLHAKISDEPYKDIYIQNTEFLVSDRHDVLCFSDDAEKSIEMLMNLLHRTFHQKEKNARSIVESLADAIQHMLLASLESPVKNKIISKLTGMIADHFANPDFEIAEVMNTLPYSPDYVRRLFRKETGVTPVAYLNRLRLAHARRLLKQQPITGDSISEIALKCGYDDPRYFSRLFKRDTGCSPQQFASQKIISS